ncbi:hypothetical protein [Mesorhizobium sp. WSM4906]|uniref:hypothetical protein n=1 Tax=Mesorhizobium sp. WSM4906 TaxID=3038546 RepID=UPI002417CFCD|nr:hypothetical protein [Mesorhizobium sp. WSM4906]WFP74744.1 hypothetical protein QAZ22_23835 [Mesorhizobium sp. WSM4906]
MLTKILAASVLAIGLATPVLAQNASAANADAGATSVIHHPRHHARKTAHNAGKAVVDPGTTSSISGGGMSSDYMNSNADQNCPAGPQGASADIPNASGRPPKAPTTVNGRHCGQ